MPAENFIFENICNIKVDNHSNIFMVYIVVHKSPDLLTSSFWELTIVEVSRTKHLNYLKFSVIFIL